MSTIQAPPCKPPEVKRNWAYQPDIASVESNLMNGHRAAEINSVMLIDNWRHSNDPAVIGG